MLVKMGNIHFMSVQKTYYALTIIFMMKKQFLFQEKVVLVKYFIMSMVNMGYTNGRTEYIQHQMI